MFHCKPPVNRLVNHGLVGFCPSYCCHRFFQFFLLRSHSLHPLLCLLSTPCASTANFYNILKHSAFAIMRISHCSRSIKKIYSHCLSRHSSLNSLINQFNRLDIHFTVNYFYRWPSTPCLDRTTSEKYSRHQRVKEFLLKVEVFGMSDSDLRPSA